MPTSPADLRSRLGALTLRDEHRLRGRLDRAPAAGDGEALAAVAAEVVEAEARVARRRDAVPPVTYPESLPIAARRDDLAAAIRDHQVVVVAGETGSGKSTQLPKLCLELGRGVRGLVGHTQPRRLAARTVAARVADELGTTVGDLVGYTVRFSDQVGERTLIKLMTDGILLAEMQRDRMLRRYDTLIVDEAHERSLNIDFLLGYLTNLLPRRPDLKVVVTSATIDTERFAEHFGAPVVEVSGRTYPVEVRYRPLGPEGGADQIDGIRRAVDELRGEGPGDILVFLSGEREIRDTATALGEAALAGTEILPLYARLSAAEQARAFRPHAGRRIVLATNVAETSITVPGVRYVVDPGTARISRFSRRTKVQRLPIEPVSQASADQRAGRCGRVAPGICIRLYGEDDYDARPPFTEPEILRTNLASVILQMAALGLGDVESFPFVDPPDAHAVRDAVALLGELGAMRDGRELTPLGRRLARLPIDPRFGRMILEAEANGCAREVLVVAAALSIQDVRERPTGQEAEADELHARFADPDSDFGAVLNLWRYLEAEQRARSSSGFRRMCRAEHLHHVRIREWQDLVRQLRDVAGELGIRRRTEPASPEAVHRSLLAGLLSHVGMYDPATREHVGARQARFLVAPGSGCTVAPPPGSWPASWWRPTGCGPAWWPASTRGGSSPWPGTWSGAATASPGGTLAGGRGPDHRAGDPVRAAGGRRAAAGARPGRSRPGPPHVHRARPGGRRLVHPAPLRGRQPGAGGRGAGTGGPDPPPRPAGDGRGDGRWFDARLPGDVTSACHFDRWWSKARRHRPDLLTFTLADLVDPAAGPVDGEAFPTTWRQGDRSFDVTYTFGPGADDDGVTVHVSLAVLNEVHPGGFDWRCPATGSTWSPPWCARCPRACGGTGPGPGPGPRGPRRHRPGRRAAAEVLARRLARMSGEAVAPGDFDLDRGPPTCWSGSGSRTATGARWRAGATWTPCARDLGREVRAAVAQAAPGVERRGLTAWDIGDLPRVVDTTAAASRSGVPGPGGRGHHGGRPALASEPDQARSMAAGTRRLLLLAVPAARRDAERRLRRIPALAAVPPRYPGGRRPDRRLHGRRRRPHRGRRGRAGVGRGGLRPPGGRGPDPARPWPWCLGAASQAGIWWPPPWRLRPAWPATRAPALAPAVADMRAQVRSLVAPGFVSRAGLARLRDVGRYLEAVRLRLDKLGGAPGPRPRPHGPPSGPWSTPSPRPATPCPPSAGPLLEVVDVAWLLEGARVGPVRPDPGNRPPGQRTEGAGGHPADLASLTSPCRGERRQIGVGHLDLAVPALPVGLAHLALEQLARRVARQHVGEVDRLRELVASQVAAGEGDELVGSSTSASVTAPTTTAMTASPQWSSGTPTTATSATHGCRASTFSTSAGYTFSPPVTIMSFTRSWR